MKGRVLGHDAAAQATVLRGEDGGRYRFSSFEWRETSAPEKGDEVDFEPEGGRARDVYRVGTANRRTYIGEAGCRPGHAESASTESLAQTLLRQPFMRFALARPVLPLALLVLFACALSAYTVDGVSMSLLAAPELAWRMSLAIDGLLAGSGADPGPRLAGAAARIATVFLLLLYAVPVLAAVAAWREFVGRPDVKLARLAGIAAMALPILLPGLVILIVRLGVLPGLDVPLRLGRDGLVSPAHAFHPIALYSAGTVLVMAAGLGLWAAASGRLAGRLAAAAGAPKGAALHSAGMAARGGLGRNSRLSDSSPVEGKSWPAAGRVAQPEPSETIETAEAAVGPSREAMMALTERLRLAITGQRGDDAAGQAALEEEEVAAAYAPPARDAQRTSRAASSSLEREAERERAGELAIADAAAAQPR